MVTLAIATALIGVMGVPGVPVPDWVLVGTSFTGTYNNNVYLSIQSNGTESAINVTPGTAEESFPQMVTGSTTNGPGWAAWLTPLSSSQGTILFAWPSSSPFPIQAGKTYYVGYKYSYEFGYEEWEYPSPYAFARRDRSWRAKTSEFEYVQ